jgi:tetratricopeptide (TPR) repeat protein
MKWWLLVVVLTALTGWKLVEKKDGDVVSGNDAFRQKNYKLAVMHYRQAMTGDADEAILAFDLGAALYRLAESSDSEEEAREFYERARAAFQQAALSADAELRAQAFYNLGNANFRLQDFLEAIGAYRNTLVIDLRHDAARHNLELALRARDAMLAMAHAAASSAQGQSSKGAGQSDNQGPSENDGADSQSQGSAETPESSDSEQESSDPEQGTSGQKSMPSPLPSSELSISQKFKALERRSNALRRRQLLRRTLEKSGENDLSGGDR